MDHFVRCYKQVFKKTYRQPAELKLCRLIVYSMFHKTGKFQNHMTRNNVIIMLLAKTIGKCGHSRNRTKYINRKVLTKAIQKCNFY